MTLDELPQACAARWYRSRARAGTAPGPPGDLAAFYASDGGCRRLVDDRVAALRSSRPSVDRDAALARWLEWLARSGGPARRDRLAEAAGLAARAAAVAARRGDATDAAKDAARLARRARYLLDAHDAVAARPRFEPAPPRAVARLPRDAPRSAVAAALARGEPVVVEGGADAFLAENATRAAWAPAALAEALGDATAPLKIGGARDAWAGLRSAGDGARAADFLANLDAEERYLHDWSLTNTKLRWRVPRWVAADLFQRAKGDDLPFVDCWPSLFVGPAGTTSELHVDAVASHFCMGLLHGEKKWTIWRPADAAWLRPRFADGGDDPLFDGPGDDGAPAPYEATQTPGDLLFVPGGAPHRVANVAATVGVAANFVDASNRDRAAAAIAALPDPGAAELARQLLELDVDDAPPDRHASWAEFKGARARKRGRAEG